MTDKKALGRRGEDAAAHYLAQKGYRILARNLKINGCEIDLITSDRGQTVFIEVKTRSDVRSGQAADTDIPLPANQARRLKKALAAYSAASRLSEKQIRLDLILVIVNAETTRAALRHYRDII